MAVSDYNTDPTLNTTISGINIAEGCAPGNLNDGLRQMMADVKGLQSDIPSVTGLMPVSGGAFTGDITRDSRGGYLHHNDSANASGRVYILPDGSADPTSPVNGDIVLNYTP